jgi:hypothetical protein
MSEFQDVIMWMNPFQGGDSHPSRPSGRSTRWHILLDWNDRCVRCSNDFPGCNFHLRRHDDLVGAFDPGDASTHQLSRAKPGQYDEFEDAQLNWTVNHSSFFLATREHGRALL